MPEIPRPFRIATRGSALALAQANLVLAQCRAASPHLAFELSIIKTTGDKLLSASMAAPDLPKGLFTKELEVALLNQEADLAVHSLKDLPTELPPGLELGAVSRRADARDVLISRAAPGRGRPALTGLNALPLGAVVATSSTRRSAQLLALRPDFRIVPIRGNVGTRLKKLAEQSDLAATILAAAGLERLNIHIQPDGEVTGTDVPAGLQATCLEPEVMLPCVGQAALGMEIRTADKQARAVCATLNDDTTHCCVVAERAFLSAMGGGCQLAVAAYATIKNDQIHLRAVSFLDGAPKWAERDAPSTQAAALGQHLAKDLK